MRFPFHIMLVCLTCLPMALGAQTAPSEVEDNTHQVIHMGVRSDVPPFIWRDNVSGEYRGFFWDICTAALVRAKYVLETVPITAQQRSELLSTGSYCDHPTDDNKACKNPGTPIDLLCDPTTVNLARMRTFAEGNEDSPDEPEQQSVRRFVFSPILYLANGSYVQQTYHRARFRDQLSDSLKYKCHKFPALADVFCTTPPVPTGLSWLRPPKPPRPADQTQINWTNACNEIQDALSQEADNSELPEVKERGAWPPQIWPEPEPVKPQFEIWGYLDGATIGPSILEAAKRAPGPVGVCTQKFESHTDAAKAFCTGRIYRYFGDIDLVRTAVEAYRIKTMTECDADETPSARGTYEPYAMVLSNDKDGFPEQFTLALYSMFTDGTIAQLFNGRFGERRQSQYLETLFRINSIPSGK